MANDLYDLTEPVRSGSVQLTEYGPDVDAARIGRNNPDSWIGDRDNPLGLGDAALTQSQRIAQFGTGGKSTGKTFDYQGQQYTDADTAPESNRRIDVYKPASGGTPPANSGSRQWCRSALRERRVLLGLISLGLCTPRRTK